MNYKWKVTIEGKTAVTVYLLEGIKQFRELGSSFISFSMKMSGEIPVFSSSSYSAIA